MPRPAAANPDLNFTDAEIPATSTVHNPFTDVVAQLAKDWDTDKDASAKAKSVTIPATSAPRLARRLGDAARAIEKSARVRFSQDGKPVKGKELNKDSKGDVVMTFWLRPAKTDDNDGDDN